MRSLSTEPTPEQALCAAPHLLSAQALAHAGPKHSAEPLTPLASSSITAHSLKARNEGLEHIEPKGYASNNKC